MMAQLHQKLVENEEALAKLQIDVQDIEEEKKPSIVIAKANTFTEICIVSSPSIALSQKYLADFEWHTKGIGLKLLRWMGYNGHGQARDVKALQTPLQLNLGLSMKACILVAQGRIP